MVKGLAIDLSPYGISANAIAPGAVANGIPQKRGLIDGPVDPSWGLTLDGRPTPIGDEKSGACLTGPSSFAVIAHCNILVLLLQMQQSLEA